MRMRKQIFTLGGLLFTKWHNNPPLIQSSFLQSTLRNVRPPLSTALLLFGLFLWDNNMSSAPRYVSRDRTALAVSAATPQWRQSRHKRRVGVATCALRPYLPRSAWAAPCGWKNETRHPDRRRGGGGRGQTGERELHGVSGKRKSPWKEREKSGSGISAFSFVLILSASPRVSTWRLEYATSKRIWSNQEFSADTDLLHRHDALRYLTVKERVCPATRQQRPPRWGGKTKHENSKQTGGGRVKGLDLRRKSLQRSFVCDPELTERKKFISSLSLFSFSLTLFLS